MTNKLLGCLLLCLTACNNTHQLGPDGGPDESQSAIRGACPVDRTGAIGTACQNEGQQCGSACCGSVIGCTSGQWVAVPSNIRCVRCDEFQCGTGSCVEGSQICVGTNGESVLNYQCELRESSVTTCEEARAAFTDSCNTATECTGTLTDFNVTVNCNCC